MKKFTATFWRGNPQITGGGYKTTRTIEAKTLASAKKKTREIEKNCCYGSMYLLEIIEQEAN